jgi:hypothetical protein
VDLLKAGGSLAVFYMVVAIATNLSTGFDEDFTLSIEFVNKLNFCSITVIVLSIIVIQFLWPEYSARRRATLIKK